MRSGKTLLSKRLADKLNFSHIPTDHLILAIQKALPNTGIGQRGLSYDELCNRFKPVLIALLDSLESEKECHFVVDGYYIRPEDILEKEGSLKAYFLGYPDITPYEKVSLMRRYGKTQPCYTNKMNESRVFRYAEEWIHDSKKLLLACCEYDKEFINVSYNFDERITFGAERVNTYVRKSQCKTSNNQRNADSCAVAPPPVR